NNFAVRPIDEMEAGIKRGGFARAGRTGDQEDAVGQTYQALEGLLVVGEKSQFRQAQAQSFLVEDTHDDAFAVIGGETGHTQIDQLVADIRLDTTVLRDAVFRDGHVRLDLEAADDGRLQSFGRRLHFVQHAVNAIANAKNFGEWFEMD